MTSKELEALVNRVDETRWNEAPFLTVKTAMHKVRVPKEWWNIVYSLVLGVRLKEIND